MQNHSTVAHFYSNINSTKKLQLAITILLDTSYQLFATEIACKHLNNSKNFPQDGFFEILDMLFSIKFHTE